jgi:hypothetical protein
MHTQPSTRVTTTRVLVHARPADADRDWAPTPPTVFINVSGTRSRDHTSPAARHSPAPSSARRRAAVCSTRACLASPRHLNGVTCVKRHRTHPVSLARSQKRTSPCDRADTDARCRRRPSTRARTTSESPSTINTRRTCGCNRNFNRGSSMTEIVHESLSAFAISSCVCERSQDHDHTHANTITTAITHQ